jgi:single-stranded DNA-binding protein
MKKLYDLAVKTDSYTGKDGQKKNKWLSVGSVVEGEKGQYIIMNRTFNPAGLPNPDNKDSIFISMFTPKGKEAPEPQSGSDPIYGKNPFDDDPAF